MDRKKAIELAKKYSEIVSRNMPVKKILLYGSHCKDTAREDSDIDIAVIMDSIEGDYLENNVKLFKLRRHIDMRIEPVLLLEGADKSGFIEDILSRGYLIYSR